MSAEEFSALRRAEALLPELEGLRERFHRRPELGNREFHTSELIRETLESWGIPCRSVLDTAVVAEVRGALPGPTVALRADMDALPVTERSGVPFASEISGQMHACGHDVHMAAALGAARLLLERRETLPGTVRFLFQPDEEGSGGAQRMIEAGCMDGVCAVFGCHVAPNLPLGTAGFRYGKFYAAADLFFAKVRGKSAHGAERENGIDALAAAAEMVTALLALPGEIAPERSVVTVGRFAAGTAVNIIPDLAEFSGILRTLGPESRQKMKRRIREVLEAAASRTGARLELELREGYSGVVNTDAETALARSAAEDLLGGENVAEISEPTLTTEDFGYLIEKAGAGCYYHVGAGCAAPLHAADFLPQPRAVAVAAALHTAVLTRWLCTKAPIMADLRA